MSAAATIVAGVVRLAAAPPLRFLRLAAAHRLDRRLLLGVHGLHAGARPATLLLRPRRALVVPPLVADAVERPDQQDDEACHPDEVEDGEERPGLERRGVLRRRLTPRLDVRRLQPAEAERDGGGDAREDDEGGRDQRDERRAAVHRDDHGPVRERAMSTSS
jgi:hypothetical protein